MKCAIAGLVVVMLGLAGWCGAADDLDGVRREAMASARLRVQAVFSGNQFPRIDFEQPGVMKQVLGTYTITTEFYDADLNKLTAPQKPGRYGAVVQIALADGKSTKRFVTLFRQPEGGRADWKLTINAEPPKQTGIVPAVAAEQSEAIGDYVKELMREGMARDSRGAVLLAALYETKPGAQKMRALDSPSVKDRQWWIKLRQKTGDYQPLKYLLHVPEGYDKDSQKKWPLMLFLHGAGERGDNLDVVKTHGPPKIVQTRKDFPFIVISPQCRTNEWWMPYELMILVDEVSARYRVDADRVYLTGLSMGGYGTWSTAMTYPNRFAAIAPICGGGDPSEVATIKHIPAWVFHGGKDPVVPVIRGEEMVEALKKIGAPVKCTVYPEAQHDSWTETYNNQELYDWMLKQKRQKAE